MPRPEYEERAVVLLEREREETDIPEVAVLNDLALAAAMTRIGGTLLRDLHGIEIKTSGLISIYTFTDCRDAVRFAEGFRSALKTQGIDCRVGVDVGQVLEFDLGGGAHDIAGSPVNVASKLAEDVGEFGTIYVTQSAADKAGITDGRAMSVEVSGVSLTALAL
jgi:class 3 adenylate cyclase